MDRLMALNLLELFRTNRRQRENRELDHNFDSCFLHLDPPVSSEP